LAQQGATRRRQLVNAVSTTQAAAQREQEKQDATQEGESSTKVSPTLILLLGKEMRVY
jgi:hypothetical protein